RANYGTIIGNFELDFASGEIRYKTSIDVEGSTLTFPQIKQLVYTNVMMMDRYLPGIMSASAGGMEVKDAIAQIES
ncbi:MAG: YbjN domain-containing protein, partial [Microcoleus sp. Co-bin12]|nr:YbjN domain-containing protein [Microcoleus sp. Co-bin12]